MEPPVGPLHVAGGWFEPSPSRSKPHKVRGLRVPQTRAWARQQLPNTGPGTRTVCGCRPPDGRGSPVTEGCVAVSGRQGLATLTPPKGQLQSPS